MYLLLLAALPSLWAQDAPNVQMPDLDAQAFRPSIDSRSTLWTDDAFVAPGGAVSLRLAGNWAHAPLVVRWGDGETLNLVRDSVNLDLLAGVTFWRLRVGADLPLYLLSTSDIEGGGGGLGDIGLDIRGSILDERKSGVGLALNGRLDLPTATVDAALGSPGLGGELGVIASKGFGDLLLAANLGTRFLTETQLVNVEVDDQFFYRVGGGYALTDAAGLSLDVAGHLNYNAPFGNPAANPLEGLVGGWYRIQERLVVRGGVGHGFTQGIASPDLRLVAMVGWEPPDDTDTDGDGILDAKDSCPEQPEDADGWEDRDGCPDPSVPLTVHIVDGEGNPIPGAVADVSGPESLVGGPETTGELHPGAYKLDASLGGYLPVVQEFQLTEGEPKEITIVLEAAPATVDVVVVGPDGQPVDATFTIGEGEPVATKSGQGTVQLLPGAYEITVRSEGYAVDSRELSLEPGETEVVKVQLRPTQVALTVEKIEVKGEVYFDTAKATIKSESNPLLDEVAQVLKDHPEILRLRIEGHTDSRGDAAYNLQLSKDRAAAVRAYLEAKGVDAARLESEGFGESKPLDKRENAAAWEKNRRVDFFVKQWAEQQTLPAAE